MIREYRKTRAVAIGPDGVFYGDGRRFAPPAVGGASLGALLAIAAPQISGEGVLAIRGVRLRDVAQPAGHGWTYSEPRAWTTYRRELPDRRVVHVALLDELRADTRRAPLFDPQTDELSTVAERLDRYHELTGSPWFATAGVAGIQAIRSRYPLVARQPRWVAELPARELRAAGPLVWAREIERDARGWVHTFDINAMYLAALRSVWLPWGALTHTPGLAFDAALPGFWAVDGAEIPAELVDGRERPPIASRARSGHTWLTTETAKLLYQLDALPATVDAYTHDNRATIARSYAERLRDARSGMLGPVPPEVLGAIKATYAELVGMLGKTGGRIHRPDWQCLTIDLARANLLRRVHLVARELDVWPVRVRTDAVSYVWPSRDPLRLAAVLGVGPGMGLFKFIGTTAVNEFATLVEQHRPVLAGQPS